METAGLVTKQGRPVPLVGVKVDAEVLGGHARVTLKQRYKNAETVPVEAVYTFPAPADATLTAFAMVCEGRRLVGVVKEREQAFRDYDEAIVQGHGAALLEQERANVFTATVGNLLPNEETVVEVEYLQKLAVEEGALRFMLPTLVAPRYIPGKSQGNRTGGGRSDPTDQVPDADRITPEIGDVAYGLEMHLAFALPGELEIESPSHAVVTTRKDGRTVVSFLTREVALDRDVVVIARGAGSGPLAGVVAHREGTQPGTFALTVVPDLLGEQGAPRHDVLFLVDTSGSMAGESLPQAQAAVKLALRHLRKGDRFEIVAFQNSARPFHGSPVVFDQASLSAADRWIDSLVADGGTELLAPMQAAMQAVPGGVVVLLTDGQVGNERQILEEVLRIRGESRTRVYSFGIGTNVSDALLRDLARATGGGVEFIHPGERIDDKVVATFAKALAPRVEDVTVQLAGVEAGELAPGKLPPLVDGEPWTLYGRYASPGRGTARVRGTLQGRPYALDVPVDLPPESREPGVVKLWAKERIAELELTEVTGRRAGLMKERIVRLAVEHGLSSPYTSFLVVEERTGDRRATAQPETRFVPVNAPAGWDMFQAKPVAAPPKAAKMRGAVFAAPSGAVAGGRPPSIPAPSPAPATAAPMYSADESTGSFAPAPAKGGGGFFDKAKKLLSRAKDDAPQAAPPPPAKRAAPPAQNEHRSLKLELSDPVVEGAAGPSAPAAEPVLGAADLPEEELGVENHDDLLVAASSTGVLRDVLARQRADGLWLAAGPGSEDVRLLAGTVAALREFVVEGVHTSHPVFGAAVRKALEALLDLVPRLAAAEPELVQSALAAAWLLAIGKRTRDRVSAVVRAAPAPVASLPLGDRSALWKRVCT